MSVSPRSLTITASAQVIVRGTESSDNTATHSEVTISTPDRTVVPLIKDSKDTKIDATTQRTESVTRERLNDGTYFDAQQTTSVKKDISPNQSVSSTDVIEKDRQGQAKLSSHTDETVVKSAAGETDQTKMYTRNSSGNLVLDRVVDANVVKGADGSATTSYEKVPDVNGNLVLQTQKDAMTVDRGPNEKVTTTKTMDVDHLTRQTRGHGAGNNLHHYAGGRQTNREYGAHTRPDGMGIEHTHRHDGDNGA